MIPQWLHFIYYQRGKGNDIQVQWATICLGQRVLLWDGWTQPLFPSTTSTVIGFIWGGVRRAPVQFMHFSAIFAMLAVLATPVIPCYPLRGV